MIVRKGVVLDCIGLVAQEIHIKRNNLRCFKTIVVVLKQEKTKRSRKEFCKGGYVHLLDSLIISYFSKKKFFFGNL